MGRDLLKEYGLEGFIGSGIYYQGEGTDEGLNQKADERQCRMFADSLWKWQNEKRKKLGAVPLDYAEEWEGANEAIIKQAKMIMIINNQSGDHQIAILCVRDDLPEPSKAIEDLYQVEDCRRILKNKEYRSGVISVFYDLQKSRQYYLARFLK